MRYAALLALLASLGCAKPSYIIVEPADSNMTEWRGRVSEHRVQGDVVCFKPLVGVARTICTRFNSVSSADPNELNEYLEPPKTP